MGGWFFSRIAVLLMLIFSCCVCCTPAQGEYPPVTIPATQIRSIQSSSVGQEYQLHIYLPPGQRDSTKTFPVLYLTDSDSFFGYAKAMVRSLNTQGSVPEMIIVGIGCRDRFHRPRDFLPVQSEKIPGSGGADNFVKFLKDELIPYVESNFRAAPDERIFVGMSAGGTLGAYLLVTSPELFHRYVIVSPALHSGNEMIIELEAQLSRTRDRLPVDAYLAVGALEDDSQLTGYRTLVANLENRNYADLQMKTEIIEGGTHMDAVYTAYVRGLKALFADEGK
ncbi:alpha/beta hydrolase [Candidatus Zixiibacteriota bacterium]